jgi:cell division protein FtsN
MPPKRKATRKTATPKKNTRPLPGWVWMLTGLAIGLSATFLPGLYQAQQDSVVSQDEDASSSKRSFDFYTLLPELEVIVDPPTERKKKTAINTPPEKLKAMYYLQAGSFKNSDDASKLKGQLALMGVETNVETVNVNNINWHRVRVGPSRNLDDLQSIQKRLREEKIDSMLLKARN